METNKLYPWQPDGVEFLRTHPGGILGDEQGLGKTVVFVNAAKQFNGPVLVVARPLAKPFIAQQIKKWDPDYAGIVKCIEGGAFNEDVVKSWFGMPRKRGYLIVHHEVLRRIASKLQAMGVWEIICVDEAHRVSNPRAQITRALKSIQAFYKWAMSGTIMDRSPADFWSLLNWFQPYTFTSYWQFDNEYVQTIRSGKDNKVVVRRPINLKKFAEVVGPFYLRRTASEVGVDEPLYCDVPISLTERQRTIYDRIESDLLVQLEREWTDSPLFIENVLQKMHYLRLAAISPSLVGTAGVGSKFDWVKDWLEDYPNERVVVFTHSKAASAELANYLEGAVHINGDVSQADRDKRLEWFTKGKVRVLVLVTDVGAESINLQVAWNAIFLDIHPSSRLMSQAEMRIRRADSTHRARIYRLNAIDTIDELFLKRFMGKISDRELVNEFLKKHQEVTHVRIV